MRSNEVTVAINNVSLILTLAAAVEGRVATNPNDPAKKALRLFLMRRKEFPLFEFDDRARASAPLR
jgi:hypothetical protein